MPEISLALTPDRARCEVGFPAGPTWLAAAELDALIRSLITLRARMVPAPWAEPPGPATPVLRAEGMAWHLGPCAGTTARLRLAMTYPGLGWIGMEVDSRELLTLMQRALLDGRGAKPAASAA